MKKFLFCLILLSFFANIAIADEQKLFKIAFVNLMKIEENSLVMKDLSKKMQKQEEKLKNDLLTKKALLEGKYKELETKQSVLSKDTIERKMKDLEKEYIEFQIDEKAYGQGMEMARMQAIGEIQEHIKYAVAKIANGNFDLVLPTSAVLYQGNKYEDVTIEVTAKLNDEMKSFDFEKNYNKVYKESKEILSKQIKKK